MFYTLDRIEGDFAVLQDDCKNTLTVPLESLDPAQPGAVFVSQDACFFIYQPEETEARTAQAKALHRALFDRFKK